MSLSQQSEEGLKRAKPLGHRDTESLGLSSYADLVKLKNSEKEELIFFVQAFANRVAYDGIQVTQLDISHTKNNVVQWEHYEAKLIMNEHLTSLSLRSNGPIRCPFLGIYFISQIIIGEALLKEKQGLTQFPNPLIRKMMLIRFRDQPVREILFICRSEDDLKQIHAALSLFRLMPRHDAAQRLQAHIRRALTQRAAVRAGDHLIYQSDGEPKHKASDDVSTQVEQSGSSSITTSPHTSIQSPLNLSDSLLADLDTPQVLKQPTYSVVGSTPDTSIVQLPSPSPRMALFTAPASSFLLQSTPTTQKMVHVINLTPYKESKTEDTEADILSQLSQDYVSNIAAQADWCCTPVRMSRHIDSLTKQPPLPKHASRQYAGTSSASIDKSRDASRGATKKTLPSLTLPINGYVTTLKRHRQRDLQITEHQLRIRDAHRQPLGLMPADAVNEQLPRVEDATTTPPPVVWPSSPQNKSLHSPTAQGTILSEGATEGRTDTTTGSRSIASGVVRVDFRSEGHKQRHRQLTEVVYIPEESTKKGTWQDVLSAGHRAATPEQRSQVQSLEKSSRVDEHPTPVKEKIQEMGTESENSAMTKSEISAMTKSDTYVNFELLDSAVSPLIKERHHTETVIHLDEVDFNASPPVVAMRQQAASHNNYTRSGLQQDEHRSSQDRRARRTSRSEVNSHTGRRDTATHDFTALFNKTELSESSWMPNISEGGEGTMTLLMADQIEKMPGTQDLSMPKPDIGAVDDDGFSISASQLGPGPRPQNSQLRLLSPLREDSGWQHQNNVRGQLSPLEKLKRAGYGLPTPFAQAAALRRSAEVPTLSARLNHSNA